VAKKSKSQVQFSTTITTSLSESSLSEMYVDVEDQTDRADITKLKKTQQFKQMDKNIPKILPGQNKFNMIDVRSSVMSIFIKGSKIFGGPKTKIIPISNIKAIPNNSSAREKWAEGFQLPNLKLANIITGIPGLYDKKTKINPKPGGSEDTEESSSSSIYTTDSEPTPAMKRKNL